MSQNKQPGAKQKGFTLSNTGEDEDEWVSSEAGSGAATPDESSSDEGSRERSRTPVEVVKSKPTVDKDEGFFTGHSTGGDIHLSCPYRSPCCAFRGASTSSYQARSHSSFKPPLHGTAPASTAACGARCCGKSL
jgi:hypothetical protein